MELGIAVRGMDEITHERAQRCAWHGAHMQTVFFLRHPQRILAPHFPLLTVGKCVVSCGRNTERRVTKREPGTWL